MPDFNFEKIQSDCRNFNFGIGFIVEGSFDADVPLLVDLKGKNGSQGNSSSLVDVPSCLMEGEWDTDVWRGHIIKNHIPFIDGIKKSELLCAGWDVSKNFKNIDNEICWEDGYNKFVSLNDYFSNLFGKKYSKYISYKEGLSKYFITSGSSDSGTPKQFIYSFSFDKSSQLNSISVFPYVSCWPRRKFSCFNFIQSKFTHIKFDFLFDDSAKYFKKIICNNWTESSHPELIWPIPEPPIEPVDEKFNGSTDLELKCILPSPIWAPISFNLGLDDLCDQSFRPLDEIKVIIVTHDLWIKLISDNTYIPCNSISLSIDRDSWGWSWSANLPKRQENLINTQQYVEINIDGYRWKGIVEKYSGNESFNSKSYTIGGRSLSAFLTNPYSSTHNRNELNSRTMKQLVEDEVYGSGWTINWDSSIIDWTVPGGVFSYSNKTTISAIMSIIQSIDCTLQSDMNDYILNIIPRYKVASWNLDSATPDKIVPIDYAISEGITWKPKELMNGVWVSGVTQGVRVKIYRNGTDGSPYHPMIINPLITHVNAGIQRGVSVLSSTGKRRNVSLTFPVINSIGILKPCDIIEITDTTPWKGYIDSVQISGNLYSVYQTVNIEDIQEV